MCGFVAGVFSRKNAPSPERMASALRSLGHRGPDASDMTTFDLPDGRTAFVAHARLALVGIEDGRQPFVDAGHATVVNGEFYDWRERRRELETRGARFRTRSDSEVAHASFALDGPEGWLRPLDGEWATAVIDLRSGRLHAACDPFGARPLRHWSSRDGRSFVVASEAKAIIELIGSARLDMQALRFALTLQYLPMGRTLFDGIGMLPPGHRIDHDGDSVTIRPWSDLILGAPSDLDPATPEEAIDTLRTAVHRRIPGERSFATHLSGGLDSALVLALASEVTGPGVDAFVADFSFGSNETEQARETASHIGANLVPVTMSASDMLNAADTTPWHSEGLVINGHASAKIIIAEAVRDAGHRCVLTGEGADEAFWGYEHLRLDAGLAMHADAAANTAGVHRALEHVDGLDALGSALGGSVPGFVRAKAAMTLGLQNAFGPTLRDARYSPTMMSDAITPSWSERIRSFDSAHAARAMWNVHGLSGYILRGLDDAMGMSRGIESRLSFLDPAVQRLAARTSPAGHFREDGLEKRLLRDGAHGLVPESVIARRKAPFMAPMLTDTREGRRWAKDRVLGGSLVKGGLFDETSLMTMLEAPATPIGDANLMTLASLARLIEDFRL